MATYDLRASHPINWNTANPAPTVRRQKFWWMIRVARDFSITTAALESDLDALRKQRNTVHLHTALGQQSFLNQSRKAFETVTWTIQQTQKWKATHP